MTAQSRPARRHDPEPPRPPLRLLAVDPDADAVQGAALLLHLSGYEVYVGPEDRPPGGGGVTRTAGGLAELQSLSARSTELLDRVHRVMEVAEQLPSQATHREREAKAWLGRNRASQAECFREPGLCVVVADDDAATLRFYEQFFARLDHRVMVALNGHELVELCGTCRPDLVIADAGLAGEDGSPAAEVVCRDGLVPFILVSDGRGQSLLQGAARDTVMACLVKPLCEAAFAPALEVAVRRFRQLQALLQETAEGRQALEDRKVIERAKGALMRRLRVHEEDAFRRIRAFSSDHNVKLVEAARRLLQVEEVFGQLDKP